MTTLIMVSVARNATALVAVSGIHQTHTTTGAGAGVCVQIAATNLRHLNHNTIHETSKTAIYSPTNVYQVFPIDIFACFS